MEGRTEKASSSSSSLTSELFGSKVNPLPSSSSFRSIFPPPSKVMGRESMQQDTVTAGWNEKSSKIGDDVDRQREEQDNLGSVYQDQRVQPCHLSSSIYYGGPDVYFQSQDSSSNSTGFFSFSRRTRERGAEMIQEVLQEEIGGKELCIIE
ncbi:hypothetical protein YC2023_033869 [Brassica napus]